MSPCEKFPIGSEGSSQGATQTSHTWMRPIAAASFNIVFQTCLLAFSQRFLRSYLSCRTYSRCVSHQGDTGPFHLLGSLVSIGVRKWTTPPSFTLTVPLPSVTQITRLTLVHILLYNDVSHRCRWFSVEVLSLCLENSTSPLRRLSISPPGCTKLVSLP
jgi:hypothetical protein